MLNYSKEVEHAKATGAPIVALESTIITHGMPYPENLSTALEVEETVRQSGATPATIAVINGEVHIGLEKAALEKLAQTTDARKLSRADIGTVISSKETGATTVAATMIFANLAGISVFATGGIGGVHQDAQTSFDISADLTELSRTPVNVVCAGAKAILDLPKTFEYLETLGVPVLGYQCDELPAFWSRGSGLATPIRVESAVEIANSFLTQQALGITGGQLICNPIPTEAEIPSSEITPWLNAAFEAAKGAGIEAKAVTPFLLQRIYQESNGRSLVANIALVKNNAKLAAKISSELTQA